MNQKQPRSGFTFHNVSINTVDGEITSADGTGFTFHNVSINTNSSFK